MSSYRNLVSVRVPAYALAEMVTQHAWTALYDEPPHPFPADTRYVRAYYDQEIDCFMLILEHPDFQPTAEGMQIMRVPALLMESKRLIEG